MISIIVPIYNAGHTIKKCVGSILAQSYKDFELILVDDGSKDDSKYLCDHYAELDSRVLVIHRENGGVSSARNCGIEKAIGTWITFIDSDDFVDTNYLDLLLGTGQCDLSITGFCGSGSDSPESSIMLQSGQYPPESFNSLFKSRLVYSPWAKLFNSKKIHDFNLRFDERVRIGEDTLFVWEYISVSDSIELIDGMPYHFTGVYGGEIGKYHLSLDDFRYRASKLRDATLKINKHWDTSISTDCCWGILHLDSLYDKYDEKAIYAIYEETIQNNLSLKQFISSPYLNPARHLINKAKNLYLDGETMEGINVLKQLENFCIFCYPASFPIVDKVIHILSSIHASWLSSLLLLIYAKFKSLHA